MNHLIAFLAGQSFPLRAIVLSMKPGLPLPTSPLCDDDDDENQCYGDDGDDDDDDGDYIT